MAETSNVPPTHDLRIYSGDDFDFAFQIQDDLGAAVPQANVTAMSGEVRATQDPTSQLIATFVCDFSQAAVDGTFIATLPAAVTAAMPAGDAVGFYDIQTTQDGKVRTRVRGGVHVVEEVTANA